MVELLRVDGLGKIFPGRPDDIVALEDVSFTVTKGETMGVVGESGSGKSTLARCILRLAEPTSGRVHLGDQELTGLSGRELRRARGRAAMVFQNPQASLNPRMSIGGALGEAVAPHAKVTATQRRARVAELLDLVGLRAQDEARYPHEFSGGQRQRIGIARALAVEPELVICDEAVSALDVSVQAQILNLLLDLQKQLGLTYLFVTHDLDVVSYMAHRVLVLYRGRVAELGPTELVTTDPRHVYTHDLVKAVLPLDPRQREQLMLDSAQAARGTLAKTRDCCLYHPFCDRAEPGRCDRSRPSVTHEAGSRAWSCLHPIGKSEALVLPEVERES